MKIDNQTYNRILKSTMSDYIIHKRMCYGISLMMNADFNRKPIVHTHSMDYDGMITIMLLLGIANDDTECDMVYEIESYFKQRLNEDSILCVQDRPRSDVLAEEMLNKIMEIRDNYLAQCN